MHKQPSIRFYLLLVLAMVTWGFAWPSGKVIAGMENPYVIIFWRFLLTAFSLMLVIFINGLSFQVPSWNVLIQVCLGGIFYTAYNVFFLLGLELGMAGLGGVIVTTLNPILTYLIVYFIEKKIFQMREIIGLILGLIGGTILLKLWDFHWESFFHSGNLFFVLCAISWALLSINSQRTGEKISPLVYSFYVFLWGTGFDFLIAWKYELWNVFQLGWNFWFQIFYLAVVSTTFGTTVYFFASTRLGSSIASSFIFLVPISALLGSWIFLNEIPHWSTVLGGVFSGLAVVILSKRK